MNNNRGWGLRAELLICLILTIFFIIAMVLLNGVIKGLNKDININDSNVTENDASKKDNNIKIESDSNDSDKDEIDNSDKVEDINYINLEDKMIVATKKYYNKYYLNQEMEKREIVTVVRLNTEEMLDSLEINNTKCSGYIIMEKTDNDVKYYPYLKCGSLYETKGYDNLLDNTDV